MKKIIVTGANGQLGSDIVKLFTQLNYKVIALTHNEIELENLNSIKNCLMTFEPTILINTAAFHHVDLCEQFPDKAKIINAIAPEYMAKLCNIMDIKFIHFSTDYVFDGKQNIPYTENDKPNPLNVYGATKFEGENKILNVNPNHSIIRVSALYGNNPCRAKNGLNFVKLMLKMAKEKGEVSVVNDELVSPTNTNNIALQLNEILQNNISGIIHATSDGQCSWYDFANEIFTYTNTDIILNKTSNISNLTPRPKYSVLENLKLKNNNINIMMPWKDALHNYLNTL